MGTRFAHVISHIGFHFSRDLDDLDRVSDCYQVARDQPVHQALNKQQGGLTVGVRSV